MFGPAASIGQEFVVVWEPGYFVPGKTDTVTESVRLTFRWLKRLKTSEHQAPLPIRTRPSRSSRSRPGCSSGWPRGGTEPVALPLPPAVRSGTCVGVLPLLIQDLVQQGRQVCRPHRRKCERRRSARVPGANARGTPSHYSPRTVVFYNTSGLLGVTGSLSGVSRFP